jgi:hypothetical protein
MFVRWKRREKVSRKRYKARANRLGVAVRDPKSGHVLTGKFLLSAVLVRAERQNGKPRQRTVAYLGSIPEEGIKEFWPRQHFWTAVVPRLASLNLPDEERQKIEAAIASRVPRPTAEEASAANKEAAENMRALW